MPRRCVPLNAGVVSDHRTRDGPPGAPPVGTLVRRLAPLRRKDHAARSCGERSSSNMTLGNPRRWPALKRDPVQGDHMSWKFELLMKPEGELITEDPVWTGEEILFTHIRRSRILRYD